MVLKAQRVALFVDSENLEITVRTNYLVKAGSSATAQTHSIFPDWKTIIPEIVGDRQLVRTLYYKEKGRPVSHKFRSFWSEEFDGEVRQPPKSVDPYIIVDAISMCEKVDVIIIFGGDKDYLPLVTYAKSQGCKVEVASFGPAAAREITKIADKFHKLTKQHTLMLERTERIRSHAHRRRRGRKRS